MTSSVAVTATRPTDVGQLTTTFTAAAAPQTTAPNSDDQNNSNGNGNSNDNSDDSGDGSNGAGLLAPFGAAAAFVAGAMALLV